MESKETKDHWLRGREGIWEEPGKMAEAWKTNRDGWEIIKKYRSVKIMCLFPVWFKNGGTARAGAGKTSWSCVVDGFVLGCGVHYILDGVQQGTLEASSWDWNDCRIEWLESGGSELGEQDEFGGDCQAYWDRNWNQEKEANLTTIVEIESAGHDTSLDE